MTDNKAVADNVLGNISRILWDLQRRLMAKRKPLDPERTIAILGIATEGTPHLNPEMTRAQYVIEWGWNWDHFHTEFLTFSLEEYDYGAYGHPEEILQRPSQDDDRLKVLTTVKDLVKYQHGGGASPYLHRLYIVTRTRSFGLGLSGTLTGKMVDLHFVLEPICDFDKGGNPIPCRIQPRRKAD